MSKRENRVLYYGDNLDIMRRYGKDESVDLIYLDPPFNSKATYGVLFKTKSGEDSPAQIKAFGDTWQWDKAAADQFDEVRKQGGKVAKALVAFESLLGRNDMLAYLTMMAIRLVEMRRVLKKTGSIYLHCDPTASHYLKAIMDAVFGGSNFRNEIVWKRKAGRGETDRKAVRFGVSHDILFFYAKSTKASMTRQYRPSNPDYIASKFTHVDKNGRRYRRDNLTSPSYRKKLCYDYKGYKHPPKGWAVSQDTMEQMEAEGRLYFPKNKNQRIQRIRFLDELPGETVDTLWDDIPPINSQAKERLGYPTQKPVALLERIIQASSNEGDVVLDPFCGCGTTIVAAEKLNRKWIGIDITHIAIWLMKKRLKEHFGDAIDCTVIGEPTTPHGARELAKQDKYRFQWWALGLVGARPEPDDEKKGADGGIDGRLYFDDGQKTQEIILSVKGGMNVGVEMIKNLAWTVESNDAQIGVLITLTPPTKPMRKEVTKLGFYETIWGKFPRLQILTIDELMEGKGIQYPGRGQHDV